MTNSKENQELLNWIKKNPELLSSLEKMRAREEDKQKSLDQVEMELFEQMGQMSRESFQRFIQNKESEALERVKKEQGGRIEGKKKLNFTSLFGLISVTETVIRLGSRYIRPLAKMLGINAGGYTCLLQEMIVDFAADKSFKKARKSLLKHHGVELSDSTIRKITLKHASNITEQQKATSTNGKVKSIGADFIITEIDGTMIPVLENTGKHEDNRKNRQCVWQEYRLCAARASDSTTTFYGVSFGDVTQAGYQWSETVSMAGWGQNSILHVVCDGAVWIKNQCEQCLGEQANFLIDYYHVCEYISEAASAISADANWVDTQKKELKNSHPEKVLDALFTYLEREDIEEKNAPVRSAYRYINNRIDQLDYKWAIERELPVGSGMVEGSHRHVLQDRLKISGAWWKKENATFMANLRVLRANQKEDEYWRNLKMAA